MAVVVVTILTAHAQYENALIVVILTAVACWVGLGLVFGIEKKDRTWW
jgi:hypothetical protein